MQRSARTMLLAAAMLLSSPTGSVDGGADQPLGGGSDIRSGSVVELTSGATIGPYHHVFADNPGNAPIEVEFRAETPAGIEITPEFERLTLEPGTGAQDRFSIAVDPALPPGDYPVGVHLVRSDITAEPGTVTNVPGVGTSFTIRVTGTTATVNVEARSLESGGPVDGTIVLASLTGTEAAFEITRVEGSALTATVAPGTYRGSYLLDGRELASAETTVTEDQTATIRLDVNTVSFVHVDVHPVEEDGRVVVANLTASVNNHLRPIDGPVTIQAIAYRNDQQIGTAIIQQTNGLPIGITEATLVYRPDTGFPPGTYRFEYELITDDFTLHAPDQPSFTVTETSLANLTRYLVIAATILATPALVGAIVAAVWLITRRLRRR